MARFRVRVEKGGGAWCPRPAIKHDVREWLEVNLHGPHLVTASETQGRFGNGQGQVIHTHTQIELTTFKKKN